MNILVALDSTGKLCPVDSRVVEYLLDVHSKTREYWTRRCQTVWDLLMAGF